MPAVVDRIVDGLHAVLLVGDDEVERIVPVSALPAKSATGSWLTVWFHGGDIVEGQLEKAELNQAATEAARARISRKLELLRKRGRGGAR